jgi:energy-coupling factor transporter ATP-binding protein EcfA2
MIFRKNNHFPQLLDPLFSGLFILLFSLQFCFVQAEDHKRLEFKHLVASLTASLDHSTDEPVYKNIIQSVSGDGSLVSLDNGASFSINWWYRSLSKKWKPGDQIYIRYDFLWHQFKMVDAVSKSEAWASLKTLSQKLPQIKRLPNGMGDPDAYSKVILDNGCVFRSIEDGVLGQLGWKPKHKVIILANPDGKYQLWNVDTNNIALCNLKQVRRPSNVSMEFDDILGLEERLNQRVLQQKEATQSIASSLLIYGAGLKPSGRPIGVFLFLGPTGVGKTELAKALASDIYKTSSSLLRFDMSHFSEPHSGSRLIGSPPGYVNHEEGGQLTEHLLKHPQTVVMLDEIEKAHPFVQKIFLPVFDEGYVLDAKNERVECPDAIFIMTSNLCGPQIAELYHLGLSSGEILNIIEPGLMHELSPELYNRVEPVLFEPLKQETMEALVDLLLDQVIKQVWMDKEIQLKIAPSLRQFLVDHGYHPQLGARPLKKLIERKVIMPLAHAIIRDGIEEGSAVTLSYDESVGSVQLD